MKKILCLAVLLTAALSLFACGKDEANEVVVYYPEMSDDNMKVLAPYNRLSEISGVAMKPAVAFGTTMAGLDALIASKKYPDMINLTGATDLDTYIKQGFAEPLDDLIEQHAPNIKKFLKDHPEYKEQITYKDGKIYNIGTKNLSETQLRSSYFIRQDWLDLYTAATGKAATWQPKSNELNDLFTWWDANVTTYDINGKSNSKPIMYVSQDATSTHVNYPNLVGLFGVDYWFYANKKTNMDLKFAPKDDKDKWTSALQTIGGWWENKWIDHNQFSSNGANLFTQYLTSTDRAGVIAINGVDTVGKLNETCQAINPKCNLVPLAPPGDYLWDTNGSGGYVKSGMFIASPSKKKVEAIKLLDAGFTQEGNVALNFGVEGSTFDMVNGRPQLKEGFTPHTNNGVRCYAGFPTYYDDTMDTGSKSPLQAKAEEVNLPYVQDTPVKRPGDQFFRTTSSTLLANEADQKFLKEVLAQIRQPIIDAYAMGLITKTKNVTSDYDKFLNDLNTQYSLSRIITLQKEALDAQLVILGVK